MFFKRLFVLVGVVAIFGFLSLQNTQSTGKPVKVFIMVGQSNMMGSGGTVIQAPEEWKPLADVLYDETVPGTSGSSTWEQIGTATTLMGPEMSFAATLRDSYPNETIAILNVSQAATGLSYWNTPGQLGHDTLMARIAVIRERLNASVIANEIPSWSFAGIVSVQGENEADGALSGAQAYETNFNTLIGRIRTEVALPHLPVILSRTSIKLDPSLGGPVEQPQLDIVRAKQATWTINDTYGAWVDTDDLMLIDSWHYGSYSQLILGKRIAKAWFDLVENRPSVQITLADGQTNKSAFPTVSYKVIFSEPVNGFTQSDVSILGNTGATTLSVTEIAPHNSTTYQVNVSGMVYPGTIDIHIPQDIAVSIASSAPNLVGIKEETKILHSQHLGVSDLLVYDPLHPTSRDLRNLDSGVGWDGKGWETQNNVSGYTSSSTTPLSYDGLLSSPAYATGGFNYQTSGRYFDLEKTFRPYMTSVGAGAIDVPGTVLWISYIIKPKDITRQQRFSLSREVSTSYSDTNNAVRIMQNNGKWSMGLLANALTDSTVPVVVNSTNLMVLRVEVGGATNPSKAHLWINPNQSILGGENPDLTTATLSGQVTSSNFKFRRINWYPGIAENHGDIDEIRLGTTFASVTPVLQTVPSAPVIDSVTSGDAQATLSFSAPAQDGGLAITGYTVTSSPGNITQTGSTSPIVITGLTNGTSYTFTVTATNAMGTSPASNPSENVTLQIIQPANIENVAIHSITQTSATITWATDQNTSTKLLYGIDPVLDMTTDEINLLPRVSTHSITLSDLKQCVAYTIKPVSTTEHNRVTIGDPYTFVTAGCTDSASVTAKESAVAELNSSTDISLKSVIDTLHIYLKIPQEYLSDQSIFQIKQLDMSSSHLTTGSGSEVFRIGKAVFNLQAISESDAVNVYQFDKPLTVEISYSDDEIKDFDESTLRILRWDGSSWGSLQNCIVSEEENKVLCQTSRFSDFALFGQKKSTTIAQETVTAEEAVTAQETAIAQEDDNNSCDDKKPNTPKITSIQVMSPTIARIFFSADRDHVDTLSLKYGNISNFYTKREKISKKEKFHDVHLLIPGRTYFFRIRSENDCQKSDWSQNVSVTMPQAYSEEKSFNSVSALYKKEISEGNSDLSLEQSNKEISDLTLLEKYQEENESFQETPLINEEMKVNENSSKKWILVVLASLFFVGGFLFWKFKKE